MEMMARILENRTTSSAFHVIYTDRLTEELLAGLADRTMGALCIPKVISTHEANLLVEGVDREGMASYDENKVWPPIYKIGPTLFDFYNHQDRKAAYQEAVLSGSASQARAFSGVPGILNTLTDRLTADLPWYARRATVGGHEAYFGLIRSMPHGAGLHYDELVSECPGFLDQRIKRQYAMNLYVSIPAPSSTSAGAVEIYSMPWSEAPRQPGSDEYWFPEECVDGVPYVSIVPEIGDIVIFNPSNLHRVLSANGERRLTISSFFGESDTNELVFWS
jgi:hypothetical protein